MAIAEINLSFDEDLIRQMDSIANNESLTRTDLIYNSIRMYVSKKQKLIELFAYGENISSKSAFTEDDIMYEIKKYRNSK